ncbi:hypothetical protein D3C85_880380 [compost metagenome]
MDRGVTYRTNKSYDATNTSPKKGPPGVKGVNDELFLKFTGDTKYQPGVYTASPQLRRPITQNDVGAGDKFNGTWQFAPALCQSITWDDGAWNNVNELSSSEACVTVPYNFNLVPSIAPLNKEFGDQGGTMPDVHGRIANSGPTKSYVGTMWQLSKVIVSPGGSIEEIKQVDDKQDGCAYYANKCTRIDGQGSGEGDSSFGVTTKTVHTLGDEQIGDLEVGSKLCYGMSVKAYSRDIANNSPEWRHSPAECVIIGKKPKVQVWGGDLSVGRRFANDMSAVTASKVETSKSPKDNNTKTFGSWVEYGIFAPDTINGIASSSGLAGQDGSLLPDQAYWSKLTFANGGHTPAGSCGGFGCYAAAGGMGTIPDVASRLAPKAVTSAPQLSGSVSLDGRNDTYYASGNNLTITGGTIEKGRSVVIKAASTVRISGDIRYTGASLSNVSEIPQVVIIANRIIIEEGVTNVDAWLIANGATGGIYTCGDLKPILTSEVCNKPLTVNGPVMAKRLFLQRTAGSGTGTASNEPAEILNLRSDAYLWAINKAGGQGSVRTLKTNELAPRF